MKRTTISSATLLLLFALIFAINVASSSALYAEDVGKYDWFHTYIGKVKFAVSPDGSPKNRNHLYVATEESVIAAINAATGETVWRKVLAENEPINLLVQTSKGLVTLSGGCRYVRVWTEDGFMQWDDVFSNQTTSNCDAMSFIQNNNEYIALLSDKKVEVRSVGGKLQWSYDAEETVSFNRFSRSSKDNNRLLAIVNGPHTADTLNTLSFEKLTGKNEPTSVQPETQIAFSEDEVKLEFSASNLAAQYNGVARVNKDNVIVTVVSKDQKQQVLTAPFNTKAHGRIERAFLQVFTKEGSAVQEFSVLLVAQDHSLSMLKGDKIVWQREEALAQVQQAKFVDFPVEKSVVSINENRSFVTAFVARILKQVEQFKTLVHGSGNHGSSVSDVPPDVESILSQDRFGFRKLIIVLTRSGKVYALHTERGQIIWSKFFPEYIDQPPANQLLEFQMFLTHTQQHTSDKVIPEIAILAEHSDKSVKVSFIASLNALNGAVLRKQALSYRPIEFFTLPQEARSTHNHPLVLIDTDLKVHVYPETEEDKKTAYENSGSIFFFVVDSKTGHIKGYGLKQVSGNGLEPVELWSAVFNDPIVAFSQHKARLNEHIHSSVHVSGYNVLHKYLNPHAFAIALLSDSTDKKASGAKTLHVYLMDGVTGKVLQHMIHPAAQGPIHIVQDENYLMYHYFNTKQNRYEISAWEMFENVTSSGLQMFSSKYNNNNNNKGDVVFSSYDDHRFFTLHRTFFFPTGVKTMATTVTTKGITTKQILVGLTNDQLWALDKRWASARRPVGAPSQADLEEGLPAYNPVLPISPKHIISYFNTIYHIRGIETEPSHLESTSHVYAFGLDQFYTRVAPSQPYDVLHNFNYYVLIMSVLALLVATGVLKYLSAKKSLTSAWY